MEMATFTALNGGSPKSAERTTNGAMDGGERPGRQSPSAEPRSAEPRSAEGYHSQRDREGREVQERRSSTNHERLPFPGAAAFADVEGSHKRKRSISDSPRRERPRSPPLRTERVERPERPERVERVERAERAERSERLERSERSERAERSEQYEPHRHPSESQDGRTTPQRDIYRGRQRDEARDNEHWRTERAREERTSSYEAPYSAGPVSAQSEEPSGDLIRRATSHGDDDQSPDGDERSMYPGQYTPEHRRDGILQSDPKKRKRNFSNRTKTGCLTCRKRKKKCDEKKPECESNSAPIPMFWCPLGPETRLFTRMATFCGRIRPVLAADHPHRQQLLQGWLRVRWLSTTEGSLAEYAREQQACAGQH